MRVLTLGTFDMFHAGHVNLLRRCRDLAGLLGNVTVGLNTDDFVERYKHRAPVIGFADREAVLYACRYVDDVMANDQPGGSAWRLIESAAPDVIVVGDDWLDRDYLGQLGVEADDLDEREIRVMFVPYTKGISSSAIRAAL